MWAKFESLGVRSQIIQHLLRAGKVWIIVGHREVCVLSRLARGDDVRSLVDAVVPVSTQVVVRLQLLVRYPVLEQGLCHCQAHGPSADHGQMRGTVIHSLSSFPDLQALNKSN